MPLLSQRLLRALLPSLDGSRAPLRNAVPERIVLGVRPGHRPSDKPPVRIFLGTERAQFRAERVFIWSVEKHRDPGRIYEIHLLKELRGFDRRLWLTGFTNYRFAIPLFCGFEGRAIYNDTDQVYLRDPAELFDQPMNGAGFLSISDRDTSVMLLDCAALAEAWDEASVRRLGRKKLEARARDASLWGPLDPGWNARDGEYHPDSAHLVHFTTLHTQPWRPFPEQFVYFRNEAVGELWSGLEAEADRAGFLPVTAARPSEHWRGARRILDGCCDAHLLALLDDATPPPGEVDWLRVGGLLEFVPDADLPWVLERLFAAARELDIHVDESAGDGRLRRNDHFWRQQLDLAGRGHPGVHWRLQRCRGHRRQTWQGGQAPAGDVLVLKHRKPGHDSQALALGQALARGSGRGLRTLALPGNEAGWVMRQLLGRGSGIAAPGGIAVVVASGWLPTRVARQLVRELAREQAGDLRLVLMGRKAGPVPEQGAAVVRCGHFGLPWHPAQRETLLPLNAGEIAVGDTAPWRSWLDAPRRVALLVGGDSRSHRLGHGDAQALARRCSDWAAAQGARLLVVTSRRTGPQALAGLAAGLAEDDLLHRWRAADEANPYGLALAHAESLVVTGESESMLADAVASGHPLLIWPIPTRAPGPWGRFCAWVERRARQPSYNRRGSERPQQGLAYLCARALERGWVLPPRRPERLHRDLMARGLAAPFGEAPAAPPVPQDEMPGVVDYLIAQLGLQQAKTAISADEERLNVSSG